MQKIQIIKFIKTNRFLFKDIIMIRYTRAFLCSLLILNISGINSSISVPSNNSLNSFSFALGPNIVYTGGTSFEKFIFYVGANSAVAQNNFAIAKASRDPQDLKFIGLTPQKVNLNNVSKQNNPLNGAQINYISLITDLPVVVKNGDNSVYFYKNIFDPNNIELISTPTLQDSNFQPVSNILNINSSGGGLQGSTTFAVVQDNAGDPFGQGNSGIALISIQTQTINNEEPAGCGCKKKKKCNPNTKPETCKHKECQVPKKEDPLKDITKKEDPDEKQKKETTITAPIIYNADSADSTVTSNKAAPFNNSTPALVIGNPVTINSNIVDMHFDSGLNRLYIAVSLTSNAAGNGARAVVIGRIVNNKIFFDPIAPNSVFTANNQIVGTGQSAADLSILKVRTMNTSTGLNYLVVLGGNGSASAVSNTIYALPLVNNNRVGKPANNTDSTQGTLAMFNQVPTDLFSGKFFNSRVFTVTAIAPTDVLTNSSQAAMVGGGALPLTAGQNVQELKVINDSVFASIADNYDGTTQPGIFYSQAVFDSNGVIQSWSTWKRVMGSDSKVTGFGIDLPLGNFWYMTGSDVTNINSVQKTLWSDGNNDGIFSNAISLINNGFPQNQAGINSLSDFSVNTPGFNNVSILIATGYDNIAFIESGSSQGGFYKPNTGNFSSNSIASSNGTYPALVPGARYVSISGGALNDIGPINASDIITETSTSMQWPMVGGVFGLAILCDSNGNGWTGNITQLSDIPAGLQFKELGDYAFVQKIKNDGTFLYVLTDSKLDRINISSSDFASGNLNVVTLASVSNNIPAVANAYFDFAISSQFALLATSVGLFRVGNGCDITIAANAAAVNWTQVDIPAAFGPVSKLFIISATNSENDFAFNGQVYALNSYRGFNASSLNRFYINLGSAIDDNTILPVPDILLQNTLSSYFNFGIFKDGIFIDGSLLMCFTSKDTNMKEALNIIFPLPKSGSRYFHIKSVGINLGVPLNSTQMNGVIRNSASGAIFVNGDFGLRVNE